MAGVTAKIVFESMTCTSRARMLPKKTAAPAQKLLPVIVTPVPPRQDPLAGKILSIVGGGT
jgi:hypothetical protein